MMDVYFACAIRLGNVVYPHLTKIPSYIFSIADFTQAKSATIPNLGKPRITHMAFGRTASQARMNLNALGWRDYTKNVIRMPESLADNYASQPDDTLRRIIESAYDNESFGRDQPKH